MVTRSSNQGSVDGFRREGLQRLVTFDLLSVQMRLEERLRMESRTIWCVYGIWRWLETMEQFTAVFLRWIRIVRFAGVPNLGKAYIERENRVQYNPQNHHKSAHGPHRRDVTHILCKVSCFSLNFFHFCRSRNNADAHVFQAWATSVVTFWILLTETYRLNFFPAVFSFLPSFL